MCRKNKTIHLEGMLLIDAGIIDLHLYLLQQHHKEIQVIIRAIHLNSTGLYVLTPDILDTVSISLVNGLSRIVFERSNTLTLTGEGTYTPLNDAVSVPL